MDVGTHISRKFFHSSRFPPCESIRNETRYGKRFVLPFQESYRDQFTRQDVSGLRSSMLAGVEFALQTILIYSYSVPLDNEAHY